MSEFDSLRSGFAPDLYRRNAFRVTGLTVEASLREIDRHWKRMQIRQKLAADVPERRELLPLEPRPELAAVREAVDRLRDPETRFFDEFFWFWALPNALDPGLEGLAQGDVVAAWSAWAQVAGVGAVGVIARHNLAVLTHALALDLESNCRVAIAVESLTAERDRCWAESLSAWKTLVEQAEFWDLVRDRIRDRKMPESPYEPRSWMTPRSENVSGRS